MIMKRFSEMYYYIILLLKIKNYDIFQTIPGSKCRPCFTCIVDSVDWITIVTIKKNNTIIILIFI